MSLLHELPVEILALVIDSLKEADTQDTKIDLFNLRRTNKHFSSLLAPYCFQSIPLWISLKALENFTALSEHPTLSSYVQEIKFSTVSDILIIELFGDIAIGPYR